MVLQLDYQIPLDNRAEGGTQPCGQSTLIQLRPDHNSEVLLKNRDTTVESITWMLYTWIVIHITELPNSQHSLARFQPEGVAFYS